MTRDRFPSPAPAPRAPRRTQRDQEHRQAAEAEDHAREQALNLRLRGHVQALRHILFCVPARIVRTGPRTILCLPDGFLHADTFPTTYNAAFALEP